MDIDQLINMVIKSLSDIIFEIEQIRDGIKPEQYTIIIKDSKGKIIKTIKI